MISDSQHTQRSHRESRGHRRHGGESHRGSRRSGVRNRTDISEEQDAEVARRHARQGHGGREGGSKAKTASALCVMTASLGLGLLAVTELVASARHEAANPFLNTFAGLAVLASFGLGGYAMLLQLRSWSQRVRRRLQVGLTLAALTLVMVVANALSSVRPAPDTPGAAASPAVAARAAAAPEEDTSLYKPGWYGELQQDGVLLVVSSFPENAAESRRFNRRVAKPVSYAACSVVNLGSPYPVELRTLQVGLLLDSGEEVRSLAPRPLLQAKPDQNRALLDRLTEPQTLAVGAMLPDLPVCQEPGFRWELVRGVKLTFSTKSYVVPGRMLTADEKRALIEKPAAQAAAAGTNRSAEAWFKDL